MDYMARQFSPLKKPLTKRPAGLKALLALVYVLFLAAQTQGLNHTHDGDLNFQADCQYCLKLGSGDDVRSAANADIPTQFSHQTTLQYARADLLVELLRPQQARAPPIA